MGTSGIQDKVVVITGASSGLGESTAKLLARQGAKVVLGARRKDRIDAVVNEISASGGKAVGFAVDVTKRVEVEALIKGAVESFGRVDVLVSDKPPPQGGGSGNGLKALFRPEAGKMNPAPSGLQEVDGLNHLL